MIICDRSINGHDDHKFIYIYHIYNNNGVHVMGSIELSDWCQNIPNKRANNNYIWHFWHI